VGQARLFDDHHRKNDQGAAGGISSHPNDARARLAVML
jgi:hypothetical protein